MKIAPTVLRLTTTLRKITNTKTMASLSTNSNDNAMNEYVPPKVWSSDSTGGSKFGSINRPTAGARFEKSLPKGKHPLQLYSLATPNGVKVNIMLEELLQAGYDKAEYDAWLINIMEQDQFGSEFVDINPNSKIPAMLDLSDPEHPVKLFESGSILLYLAEKFGNAFLPSKLRTQTLNWLFWQMGAAPYLGGGFGHFYAYADQKLKYPIDRFTMEAKRQLDVLDKQLAKNKYIVGDEYTIADMAIFPWYGNLVLGKLYGDSATFLNVQQDYPHVIRWAEEMMQRPAVQRGRLVNSSDGIAERHDKSDIDIALRNQEKNTASTQ